MSRTATVLTTALLTTGLVSLLPLVAGCGYSLGARLGTSENSRTGSIAIPTFENQTFPLRRDLEFELTSGLRKAVQARTSWTIVADGSSDVSVYGTIRDLRERVLADDEIDRKIESMVSIVVHLRIEDYRSRNVREEIVTESEPLSITQGETLATARRRAVEGLARKILDQIQAF